jgi:hypothetical protein
MRQVGSSIALYQDQDWSAALALCGVHDTASANVATARVGSISSINTRRQGRLQGPKIVFSRRSAVSPVALSYPSLTRSLPIFFHLTRVGEALLADTLHHKHYAIVLLISSTTPPHLAGPRRRRSRCAVHVQRSEAPPVVALGSDREEEMLVRLRRPRSFECFRCAIYKGM